MSQSSRVDTHVDLPQTSIPFGEHQTAQSLTWAVAAEPAAHLSTRILALRCLTCTGKRRRPAFTLYCYSHPIDTLLFLPCHTMQKAKVVWYVSGSGIEQFQPRDVLFGSARVRDTASCHLHPHSFLTHMPCLHLPESPHDQPFSPRRSGPCLCLERLLLHIGLIKLLSYVLFSDHPAPFAFTLAFTDERRDFLLTLAQDFSHLGTIQ